MLPGVAQANTVTQSIFFSVASADEAFQETNSFWKAASSSTVCTDHERQNVALYLLSLLARDSACYVPFCFRFYVSVSLSLPLSSYLSPLIKHISLIFLGLGIESHSWCFHSYCPVWTTSICLALLSLKFCEQQW